MRAAVVGAPSLSDPASIQELPIPRAGQGEVLVRVGFAAVNWSDIQKRQGIYPDPVQYPLILGAEVAGTVEAVGPGVDASWSGKRVAALCGPRLVGGCAEFVSVPLSHLMLIPPDSTLTNAEWAAVPLATITAYHLLHTAHELRAGQVVLIHAAAGSVGLALVQLVTLAGAVAIGTVGSGSKRGLPEERGAALVIDRSRDDFVSAALSFTNGAGVDLVIDSLGADILPRSFDALRRFGRLINIGEAAGEPDFPVRKKLYERSTSMAGFEVLHAEPGSDRWKRGVDVITAQVASGRLSVPVDRILPLTQISVAHAALEGRATLGKVLLKVGRADA